MKLSFSIHVLGWLLTGQNWPATGQSLPQLSISVSPKNPITQGAIVRIDCNPGEYSQISFQLLKKVPLLQHDWEPISPKGKERTFSIGNVQTTDGGIYACRFCLLRYPNSCSDSSNSVKIFITEQRYPAPSLSASPSTEVTKGENIVISCKGDQQPTAEFRLYKGGSLAAKKEEENEAAFQIASATRLDGGIYQCNYCRSAEFFEICSYYSNSTPVFIRDPSLRKPSIKARPSQEVAPGLNFTIECQGPAKDLNFSLYKSSTLIASQITEPDGNTTKFSFSKVNVNNTGNYSCQYRSTTRSFVWSLSSNLIRIVMRDEDSGKDPAKRAIQAGAAAGSLFLVLLLLLLAFILYRKRKKGSTAHERPQTLPMKGPQTPLEPKTEDDSSGVSYAELRLQSPNTKQAAKPDSVPESCVYASVANDRPGRANRQDLHLYGNIS